MKKALLTLVRLAGWTGLLLATAGGHASPAGPNGINIGLDIDWNFSGPPGYSASFIANPTTYLNNCGGALTSTTSSCNFAISFDIDATPQTPVVNTTGYSTWNGDCTGIGGTPLTLWNCFNQNSFGQLFTAAASGTLGNLKMGFTCLNPQGTPLQGLKAVLYQINLDGETIPTTPLAVADVDLSTCPTATDWTGKTFNAGDFAQITLPFSNVSVTAGSFYGVFFSGPLVPGNQLPGFYTIGGSVNGLGAGNSLILQNNGGDDLTVTADGNFTFATGLTEASSYSVSVLTQPTGQTCNVTNGSGTANANVTNIQIDCVTDPVPVDGTCGAANNVYYASEPTPEDLCATGVAGSVTLLGDGRYTWSCTGTGGGATATCYTLPPSGPENQAPLTLSSGGQSQLRSGRKLLLTTSGGSGTGAVSYAVSASGKAKCKILTRKTGTYLKATGKAGACTVTATKAGDNDFNPVTSAPLIVNVQ